VPADAQHYRNWHRYIRWRRLQRLDVFLPRRPAPNIAYAMAKAVDLCHKQIPVDHFNKRPMTIREFCVREAGQLTSRSIPGQKNISARRDMLIRKISRKGAKDTKFGRKYFLLCALTPLRGTVDWSSFTVQCNTITPLRPSHLTRHTSRGNNVLLARDFAPSCFASRLYPRLRYRRSSRYARRYVRQENLDVQWIQVGSSVVVTALLAGEIDVAASPGLRCARRRAVRAQSSVFPLPRSLFVLMGAPASSACKT